MNRYRNRILFAVVVATLLAVPGAARAEPSEDSLIAVLKSNAPAVEKNNACRALKTVGAEKSIPALAALLTDAELSHPARLALESMPYPAAGTALREAAGKTAGRVRSGLIDSLGERRDAAAVPVIAPALNDADKQVVAAAAWALGKIGTVDATEALRAARAKAAGDRLAIIGQGMVLCANNLLRAGKTTEAAAIFGELAAPGESRVVRAGALAGMARVKGPKRVEVVRGLLASEDVLVRAAGAGALPDLAPHEFRAVAADLSKLPAASQVALLTAVRIRADRALLPVALEALASPNDEVCMAAIRALGSVGDTSALPKLLPIAAKEGPTGEAARKSIESLAGADIDAKILAALRAENDPRHRAEWIGVLQARHPAHAVAVLLEEARHADPTVRGSAMAALGQLALPKDLPGLIAGVLAAKPGPERDAAERAVVRVGLQIKDPAERADAVLAAVKARPADQNALLPLAGRFGGIAVAAMVQAALASSDSPVHEAGLRALCNWPDASVADQLLKLTEAAADSPERSLTLRAYTRVVSLPRPNGDAQRLAGLKRAMALAQRDEERVYVLERAAAIRVIETLRFVAPYCDDPALAEAACKAVADLAHHRELRDPNKAEFRAALEKVLRTSKDRLILERAKRYWEST